MEIRVDGKKVFDTVPGLVEFTVRCRFYMRLVCDRCGRSYSGTEILRNAGVNNIHNMKCVCETITEV